jgi:hypothetical protein
MIETTFKVVRRGDSWRPYRIERTRVIAPGNEKTHLLLAQWGSREEAHAWLERQDPAQLVRYC